MARKTNTTAPATAPDPPVVDIAQASETAEIKKATRQYEELHRAPLPAGGFATVRREKRADGSLGEYLFGDVRINADTRAESATLWSVARVREVEKALTAAGIRTIK